jgi:hypothetical protein
MHSTWHLVTDPIAVTDALLDLERALVESA